jgi:hypothetical protein
MTATPTARNVAVPTEIVHAVLFTLLATRAG